MSDPLGDIAYPGDSSLGTDLALLPISPERVLATWNRPQPHEMPGRHDTPHARAGTSNGAYRLRLCEVVADPTRGDALGREWLVDIGDGQTDCVVNVTEPGMTLRAELVRANGTNGSLRVALSRRVQMPQVARQDETGRILWMICDRPDRRRKDS